jgi:hypothetical protein
MLGHTLRLHNNSHYVACKLRQSLTPLGPDDAAMGSNPPRRYFHNDSMPEAGYPLAGRTIPHNAGEPDFAARDASLDRVLEKIGWPDETRPKKVIVPAGSVAFTHFGAPHNVSYYRRARTSSDLTPTSRQPPRRCLSPRHAALAGAASRRPDEADVQVLVRPHAR